MNFYRENAKEKRMVPWQIRRRKLLLLLRIAKILLVPFYFILYPFIRFLIHLYGYVLHRDFNYYFVYDNTTYPDFSYWQQKISYWDFLELPENIEE